MIRISVLGSAAIAKRSILPHLQEINGFSLVGIGYRDTSISKEKATQLAQQFSCVALPTTEILRDIDALYIPYPPALHFEWIKKAIQHGIHVLCEKPMALNCAQLDEIFNLASVNNVVVVENYMFLHHSQHKKVLSILSEIGEIRNFRAAFAFPPFVDPDNIRYQNNLGGGATLDCSGYPIQAALFFLGNNLQVETHFLKMVPAYDQGQIDLYGDVTLRSENGVPAQIYFGFDNAYQCMYEIHGSKGIIRVPKAYTPRPNYAPTIELTTQRQNILTVPAEDQFFNILQHFRSLILQNQGISHTDWNRTYNTARIQEIIQQKR